jgi:dipeptidyl-peptidase-4
MCLALASDVFKCAVSGAPVTSWDGYDTCYTERYMGTPEGNPEGYKSSSVMENIAGMKGDLMLVHGLLDENVHFRHTARLINALIDAQKPYQLLLFPNERHGPRSAKDREYMEERIMSFIEGSIGK